MSRMPLFATAASWSMTGLMHYQQVTQVPAMPVRLSES
jgi:hypothetical protein